MSISLQELLALYPSAVRIGGLDEAIIGVVHRNGQPPALLYSRARVIWQFMDGGMGEEMANDAFEDQIMTIDLGPQTPVFADLLSDDLEQSNG